LENYFGYDISSVEYPRHEVGVASREYREKLMAQFEKLKDE